MNRTSSHKQSSLSSRFHEFLKTLYGGMDPRNAARQTVQHLPDLIPADGAFGSLAVPGQPSRSWTRGT